MIIRKCLTCQKEFKTVFSKILDGRGKYCSRKCSDEKNGKNIIIKCSTCGKKFIVWPHRIKISPVKYCSNNCYHKSLLGKKGQLSKHWQGGKTIDRYSYILKRNHPHSKPNGYIAEHRLIVEKIIGRYLKKIEHIHHINGIKTDNRPENLYLFPSNSQHMKYESSKNKSFIKSNLII